MNTFIDTHILDDLKYNLFTSAKSLNSVWNDKQYKFFIENYIQTVTADIIMMQNNINEEIPILTSAINELEDLANKY